MYFVLGSQITPARYKDDYFPLHSLFDTFSTQAPKDKDEESIYFNAV